MTKEQIMVELFEFSAPTYYKWTKKEKRKIFDLLNYAFTLEELEEFINSGKIQKIEIINNNQGLINKVKEFVNELVKNSNIFIAKNVLNQIKEHCNIHNKLDYEELRFELFYLDDYFYMECADEDFLSQLNDFDMKYNVDLKEFDSIEHILNKITLNTKYRIITQIGNTPKEILEFVLNFEVDDIIG
jgi:hypothetical protein